MSSSEQTSSEQTTAANTTPAEQRRAARLLSIQTRITNIRNLLEDASSLTSVSSAGVSESIDRRALNEELKDLERQEAFLTGESNKLIGIDLTRC